MIASRAIGNTRPYDPKSLVDYLKSKGRDSSFAARARFWKWEDIRTKYVGSESQNSRILEILRAGDAAPSLSIENATVPSGSPIEVRINSRGPVLVESPLLGASRNAAAGETISLGNATGPAAVPVVVRDQMLIGGGLLVVYPREAEYEVFLAPGASVPGPAPAEIPMTDSDLDLLRSFVEQINPELLKTAVRESINFSDLTPFLIETGVDIQFGITLALVTGGTSIGATLGGAALGGTIEIGKLTLEKLIDQSAFGVDQKARLHEIREGVVTTFEVVPNALKVTKLRKTLKEARNFCARVKALEPVNELVVKAIEDDDDLATTWFLVLYSYVGKSVTLLCDIKKKKPGGPNP